MDEGKGWLLMEYILPNSVLAELVYVPSGCAFGVSSASKKRDQMSNDRPNEASDRPAKGRPRDESLARFTAQYDLTIKSL